MSGRLFSRSDHRPIVGNVEIQIQSKHSASKPRSLIGWKPESSESAADYQERCADLPGDDLMELQGGILSAGTEVSHATRASRRRQEKHDQLRCEVSAVCRGAGHRHGADRKGQVVSESVPGSKERS